MAKQYIIGIDLGGTNLKVGLLDSKYKILHRETLSTQKFKKQDLIPAIANSINRLIESNNLNKKNILGIGLGLPGPVDHKKGLVHFFPNIPGFREVKLKSILEKRIGFPVFLDNDAKLMSLAEYRLGSASGFKNALCLTLGTGVGGGLIINDNIYRGVNNASGEIGHIPLNERGPRCNCGSIACLEAYIGNNRILKRAKQIFRRNITLEELSLMARRKNKQALTIWHEVGERLGIALAGVVNLLNLDAIIIGGGVAGAGSVLFERVRKIIRRRAMAVQAKHVKVLKARLGKDAGLIGAAILVEENVKG